MGGQVSFLGIPGTTEGKLVIDSYFWPPEELGPLEEPIEIEISKGRIQKITSNTRESRILEQWLKGQSQHIAHLSIGTHPRATLKKGLLEAERYFGAFVVGFGSLPFHTDGIIKSPKITVDGQVLLENGRFSPKDLAVGDNYFDF